MNPWKQNCKVLTCFQTFLHLEMLRNNWTLDRHVMGAYSYQVAGITKEDHARLKRSVEQSLWFAGEYTEGWEFGYTHGAFASGKRVASEIEESMDPSKTTSPPSPTTKSTSPPLKTTNCIFLFIFIFIFVINN